MSARSAHIIGDGPAGLVAALALAQRGWRVSLKAACRQRPARIDVLGGAALPVLERLGLGRNDVTGVARPCPGRWVDWGGEPYCVDHMRSLSGAWSVDRPAFDELLAGLAIRSGVRFGETDDTDPKGWTIDAADRGSRTPRLLQQIELLDDVVDQLQASCGRLADVPGIGHREQPQ